MCNNSLQLKPNFPLEKREGLGISSWHNKSRDMSSKLLVHRAWVTRTLGLVRAAIYVFDYNTCQTKATSLLQEGGQNSGEGRKKLPPVYSKGKQKSSGIFYQCQSIIKLANQTNLLNLIFSPQTRPKSRYRWPVTSSEMHHKIKSRHSASYLSIGSKKYNIWWLLASQTRPKIKKRQHQYFFSFWSTATYFYCLWHLHRFYREISWKAFAIDPGKRCCFLLLKLPFSVN